MRETAFFVLLIFLAAPAFIVFFYVYMLFVFSVLFINFRFCFEVKYFLFFQFYQGYNKNR